MRCACKEVFFSLLRSFFPPDNQENLQQQEMMGMASQTGTSHSSLASPPTTVQPVRQSSMAPAPGPQPAQRMKSQTSHQLSVSSAAASTPPKQRPQSGNLLQSPESAGYGGRGQQAPPRQQLSVKDNTPPGLPHQQSSARESQGSQGSQAGTPQSTQQSSKQQQQLQLQPLPQGSRPAKPTTVSPYRGRAATSGGEGLRPRPSTQTPGPPEFFCMRVCL